MKRSARALAALPLAALALVAGLSLVGVDPAAAQRASRIDLVAQTTFVTDAPVVFDVRITGNVTGRILNVRVFPPRTDWRDLATLWEGGPADVGAGLVADFDIADLATIAVGNDVVSVALPDEEIGLLLRREQGALPVVIELREADGTPVDTIVTAVLVDDGTRSSSVDFGFVADGRSPFAYTPTTTAEVRVDPAAAVGRIESVAERAPAPTLISFAPETLTALADPRTADGLLAIDRIRTVIEPHEVPLTPWVELDEEAWRGAGEADRVFAQYASGQATIEDFLGLTPTPIARFDASTTAETVQLLRSVGITGGVVEPDQIDPLDLDRADNRPIDVLDANGVTMPVVVIDRAFETTLAGLDPELVAQQRFAELVLRARSAGTSRAIVLDLDTVDPVVLTLLLDLAATTERVGTAPISALIDRSPARDATGSVLRAELVAAAPTTVSGATSDIRLNESLLASYTEMVAPADAPIAPLRTLLVAAMADSLDADQRRRFTDTVFDVVSSGSTDFEVVEGSRVTLAAQTATLPIEIRNDQTLPINVVVRITSDKLRFPDGEEQRLVLDPGINALDIAVVTAASGDARIQITVTSPDGRLDLAAGAVDVRSTAVSGLGLIVSLVSFAILLAWWARTIARVRRQRRAGSVSDHPSGPGDAEAPDVTAAAEGEAP
ncbi:MAG: DUF6049 family protein [Actinomycetota bacterium]